MKKNNGTSTAMYGISRVDCEKNNTHSWRVSLVRRGQRHVKNFPDKKCGSKAAALRAAKEFRDKILQAYPPISRKEFCNAKRRNNKTGITGVYKYSKPYKLKDGSIRDAWYWEANWPNAEGESISKSFSVKRFGDDMARQMAVKARKSGLQTVQGTFWAAERGNLVSVHGASGDSARQQKVNLFDSNFERIQA